MAYFHKQPSAQVSPEFTVP